MLLRELPLNATIRLWDTYLSEPDGFNKFHLYVCAAFLCRWKQELETKRDFQSILLFIQNVPTAKWHDKVSTIYITSFQRPGLALLVFGLLEFACFFLNVSIFVFLHVTNWEGLMVRCHCIPPNAFPIKGVPG